MAIELSDSVLSKAPKPLDLKMYVGNFPTLPYKTKELLDDSMLHEGMIVHAFENDRWLEYRYLGNNQWQLKDGGAAGYIEPKYLTASWKNSTINNTNIVKFIGNWKLADDDSKLNLFVNGILLKNSSVHTFYTMVLEENKAIPEEPTAVNTIVTFSFPIEPTFLVQLVKIYAV